MSNAPLPSEAMTDLETPRPDLPDPIRIVLQEAADIVSSRPAATTDHDRLAETTKGVRQLLVLLRQSVGLRAATSTRPAVVTLNLPATAPGSDPCQVAANLIAPDGTHTASSAAIVTGWLDSAEQAARRARRESRRAPRPSAEQRAERRERARVEELRAARDRFAAQAEFYRKKAADLDEQVTDLAEEVAALNLRLSAANKRLEHSRRAAADPIRLAEALAALIGPAHAPIKPDHRPVQAGEPPRVDPGRRQVETMLDLDERLQAAAAQVALPEAVRATMRTWLPQMLAAFADPPRPRIKMGDERGLAVEVLGGGTQIGGSCVFVSAGGTRILIDAGTRPGGTDEASLAPPRINEALSAPLDAIVVTHAHNDHGGWVPAILRRQPRVPVFVTDATNELLSTMWFDAAKVLARRVEASDSWAGAPLPPYSRDDVDHAVENLRIVPYGRRQSVGALDVELFPAGHIVGAASVVIHAGERRVVVSGDVSGPGQSTVGGIIVPDSARHADLLLLESTYADKTRMAPRQLVISDFVRDIANTIDAGGRVLVPAFALGRAQEIALILAEHLPDVEVLIDGLARDISEVYERHHGPDGKPLRIFADNVKPVERGRSRVEMARLKSGVVIATSGMLTSGPAVGWAQRILPDGRSTLMIVGYQDEDSPGRQLLELSERGGKEFALPQSDGTVTTVSVAAHVKQYQLGAHASADELALIAADVQAAQVMLVHGQRDGQAAFSKRLALRRQATVPSDLRWNPPNNI
jgi:Cft2 family RNA processing exonuclease